VLAGGMLQDRQGRQDAAGSGPWKRACGCPALGSFAHVSAPDHWPVRSDFIDRFILVVFHRSNAIKPDNRLLLLGYFFKTCHFAGRRPV